MTFLLSSQDLIASRFKIIVKAIIEFAASFFPVFEDVGYDCLCMFEVLGTGYIE